MQIWKEAFDHFDREPKKFETNEICLIMDTRSQVGREPGFTDLKSKVMQTAELDSGRTEDESVNEPDKDGFTKLTKAEQLELPFDLLRQRKADFGTRSVDLPEMYCLLTFC